MATIARVLPRTNVKVYAALRAARLRLLEVADTDHTLRIETREMVLQLEIEIKEAMRKVHAAKAKQFEQTELKQRYGHELRLLAGLYLKSVDAAIARGKLPEAVRVSFGLSGSSGALPIWRRDADLLSIVQHIVGPEQARIAVGGMSFSDLTLADLEDALASFEQSLTQLNELKNNLSAARKQLNDRCAIGRQWVRRVWAEVESSLGNQSREAMRARAALWGVDYAVRKVAAKKKNPRARPVRPVQA